MTRTSRLITLALLIIAVATGCKEQPQLHPAEGKWQGSMVSNGVIIDIGTVTIGASHISLPESKVFYGHLEANVNNSNVSFSDPKDPAFHARVRMIDHETASLRIEGFNGYFELTKEG